MKYILHLIITLMQFAITAFIVSLVFGVAQWLLSLTGLVPAPTWIGIIGGAFGVFFLFFVYSTYKVLQHLYHGWKDPVYKQMSIQTGISWDDYKRLRESDINLNDLNEDK